LAHKFGGRGRGRERAAAPKAKYKKHRFFLDTMISNVLRDLHYSLNQLLKSSNDWHIGILENIDVFRMCGTCRFFFFIQF
jgi:hypothetical protein